MAQAYVHAILPLCNNHDLRTHIRWGLADFRHRFGREAESLWLPETACNDAVMDALIDEGLRFVILAPHQAAHVSTPMGRESDRVEDEVSTGSGPGSPRGQPAWGGGCDRVDLSIDTSAWHGVNEATLNPSIPYRYSRRDHYNESIDVFFYDGPTARAIAFENLLRSSRELVEAFARSVNGRGMINVATDGETYGHHFKFGDLCLAYALELEAPTRGFQVTNYRKYLDAHTAKSKVKIDNGPDGKGTSWSCRQGVDRWSRDC